MREGAIGVKTEGEKRMTCWRRQLIEAAGIYTSNDFFPASLNQTWVFGVVGYQERYGPGRLPYGQAHISRRRSFGRQLI